MSTHPSHKELTKKLNEAIAAVSSGSYLIIEENRHFPEDMQVLRSSNATKHFEKILKFLEEIHVAGGPVCYVGAYPAYKCYHPPFQNVSLFAFAWESKLAGKRMYLKFGIRLNRHNIPTYLYLNCHPDEPQKKQR